MFIHGLDSNGQSFKARLLRKIFPQILTPDFVGLLPERMARLHALAGNEHKWTLIGFSFGGLMATLLAVEQPTAVKRMILLAPALLWPDTAQLPITPITIPTVIIHGQRDELFPLDLVRSLATRAFTNLTFIEVDDDHGLRKTVQAMDWPSLLSTIA